MIHNHIKIICTYFDLGVPIKEPVRVLGGLLHTMWRIDTDKNSYAIKQLSKDIDLNNERVKKNYELSEFIASSFIKQRIPAICAIEKAGNHLVIIDGIGFLVYPWINAKILHQDVISENHALKIAIILAKMHNLNLDITECLNFDNPEIIQMEFHIHSKEKILALIDKAENFNCPFVPIIRKNQRNILFANEAYQNAIPILKTHLVISHGDLDQKNVLWDSYNNPILIDWESACKINPTYDIINTAFYWSGITSNFNKELFLKIIDTYQKTGGIINKNNLAAAFYGSFSWINWMVYNIERSCVKEESESKAIGVEQVNQTLSTILRLQEIIPELIKIITEKL